MGDWRDEASCSTAPDPDLWYASTIDERREAIEICASCPVRANCLAWALTTGEQFGIWGGVDFEEPRRAARAAYVRRGRPRRKPAPVLELDDHRKTRENPDEAAIRALRAADARFTRALAKVAP